MGALCASGALILMADADGATPFTELDKLEKRMNQVADGDATHPAVVIGSRAHLQNDAVAKRSFMRNILMHGFHWMVHVLGVAGIRDTQCGFKLFTRRAAAEVGIFFYFCSLKEQFSHRHLFLSNGKNVENKKKG